MRLGGFVIHGNNAGTLDQALEGLAAVCDEVVAVDSGSTDGSVELVQRRKIRSIVKPWEGYGAARAVAAEALSGCDYLFFLDSDESLSQPGALAISDWKRDAPSFAYYRLPVRDWADLPSGRFLFRTERHIRILRRDKASWRREMIVHEAMPRAEAGHLAAPIDHRFASSIDLRKAKEERYALLWALRAFAEGRPGKWPAPQRIVHAVRNALLKGAAFRGGWDGIRLAWAVARYHQRKYEYLRRVWDGEFSQAGAWLSEGRLAELFAWLDENL